MIKYPMVDDVVREAARAVVLLLARPVVNGAWAMAAAFVLIFATPVGPLLSAVRSASLLLLSLFI